MEIRGIKGVKDILPGEIEKWHWVERKAHKIFSRYGFKEIRVPVFEKSALFERGIGETTDIVEKEMYTFSDRGGERLTLRPEGTASVVRSYIEHKLYNPPSVTKLYYLGPMFRYERPQAGRFRQFYQIGAEAMGSDSPAIDAEVITLVMEYFRELGLENPKLLLNSLGCPECRPPYREILKTAIRGHLPELCGNCNQRYERNPLRILDCKVERDREIARELPKTSDHLCEKCRTHFEEVKQLLASTKTDFTLDALLVRGLDYYSRTTFEVVSSGLGAQNAICGGGRYDSLVEEFDGPATPCFGFALGLERLISIVPFDKAGTICIDPDLFVIGLGAEAQRQSFRIVHELRAQGFHVDRAYEAGSLKSQMRKANKAASRFVLIIGENEIKTGRYLLKNMQAGGQAEIAEASLIPELKRHLDKLRADRNH